MFRPTLRFELQFENGKERAKNGALEKFRSKTIKKEMSEVLVVVAEGATATHLKSCIERKKVRGYGQDRKVRAL